MLHTARGKHQIYQSYWKKFVKAVEIDQHHYICYCCYSDDGISNGAGRAYTTMSRKLDANFYLSITIAEVFVLLLVVLYNSLLLKHVLQTAVPNQHSAYSYERELTKTMVIVNACLLSTFCHTS